MILTWLTNPCFYHSHDQDISPSYLIFPKNDGSIILQNDGSITVLSYGVDGIIIVRVQSVFLKLKYQRCHISYFHMPHDAFLV